MTPTALPRPAVPERAGGGRPPPQPPRPPPTRPPRLDALTPTLDWIEPVPLGRPVVHRLDREADAVAHGPRWLRRGRRLLLRADGDRLVWHRGREQSLAAVGTQLRAAGAFRRCRTVSYQGRPAEQWVAETPVTLQRPAQPHRTRSGRRHQRWMPGRPLTLRLVVSRVAATTGAGAAAWLLLTNLPADVPSADVALWYYGRWRIESSFKLRKGAGQQLEHGQQETAEALARWLLVASRAGVVVWQWARDERPAAAALREDWVRRSGRQMKRGRAYTEPAWWAGLWVLLVLLATAESGGTQRRRELARQVGLLARADSSSC